MADVIPAPADLRPELLEEHLWNTDPKLNGFMFRSRDVLLDVLRCEWPETRGLLCHAQALVVMDGSSVSGLLIGHTAREYGPNFEAAKTLQMGRLKPDDKEHMDRALDWMDRLFPQPGQGAYYVLELSTAPSARGTGLASDLLDAAERRARDRGCTQLSLDVAADNAAVDFYRHKGFDVEIETRVPYLEKQHGIGLHFHMVRHLETVA